MATVNDCIKARTFGLTDDMSRDQLVDLIAYLATKNWDFSGIKKFRKDNNMPVDVND